MHVRELEDELEDVLLNEEGFSEMMDDNNFEECFDEKKEEGEENNKEEDDNSSIFNLTSKEEEYYNLMVECIVLQMKHNEDLQNNKVKDNAKSNVGEVAMEEISKNKLEEECAIEKLDDKEDNLLEKEKEKKRIAQKEDEDKVEEFNQH